LANALFLGVPAAATDVILESWLAPLWPKLADAAAFRPDVVSPDALEALLHVLAKRGALDGLTAAQTVLRWAHRGGWGAPQSARLNQLLDAVAPRATLSAEAACALAQTAVSRQLLDVAVPADAARGHMVVLATQLVSARTRIEQLTLVLCPHCNRHVRREEYASQELLCDRHKDQGVHRGVYSNGYGWSCCGERKKRTPGCYAGYYKHTDPAFVPPPAEEHAH
jgi:hypothetical protein